MILVHEYHATSTDISYSPRLINANRIIDVAANYDTIVLRQKTKDIDTSSLAGMANYLIGKTDTKVRIEGSLIHLAGRSHEDRIKVKESPEEIYRLINEAK